MFFIASENDVELKIMLKQAFPFEQV